MNSYQLVLIVIGALALLNLATLAWVAWLQQRLKSRDQTLTAAVSEVHGLEQKADKVAAAEMELEKKGAASVASALEEVGTVFSRDLATTTLKITQQMEAGASQLIEQELGQYRETLANLRESATAAFGQINDAIDKQKATLTADLEAEIQKQKETMIIKFEAKISDVVSAYLVESLGNDVDLGAQSQYLFKMLEEHKDELKKEIMGGA